LEHGINCRVLAESLGVSYDHLNRLARAHWSRTLKAYVLERQIERAVYMLLNTTMPVKTIALSCGFNDSQHLNKTMRKMTGHSPTAIRKT
jgi:AraC-like DNA-binding protein